MIGAPGPGAPHIAQLCDVWVLAPPLRHESTTIVLTLSVRSRGRPTHPQRTRMSGAPANIFWAVRSLQMESLSSAIPWSTQNVRLSEGENSPIRPFAIGSSA
jgi:hypothetical protein